MFQEQAKELNAALCKDGRCPRLLALAKHSHMSEVYAINTADTVLSGPLLAFVGVPTDEVTNCAFGGDDLKTLYITGGDTLYCIKATTPGRVLWPKK